MKRWIVAATVVVMAWAAAGASAQPLAERVPGDAVFYLGWKGSGNLGPAYEGSATKAIVDASGFKKFYAEVMPQVLKMALEKDANEAEQLANGLTIFEIYGRRGVAVYGMAAEEVAAGASEGRGGIVCDAGVEADTLEKLLRATVVANPKMAVKREGNVVAVVMGEGVEGKLADAEGFKGAMKRVAGDPVVIGYVDLEKFWAVVDREAAKEQPEVWAAMKKVGGLEGVKRWVGTGVFGGGGAWETQTFTEAPEPRSGWVKMIHGEGTPRELLARVPEDATYVRAGHFDPVGWLKSFREVAVAVDANEGGKKFDQVMGAAQLYLGRNLINDILGPLGTEWAIYTSPAVGKGAGMSGVVVNKLSNESKAKAGLTAMTYALANTSQNPAVRAQGFAVRAEREEIEGVQVTYLKPADAKANPRVANLAVAWAVKDGMLYIGLDPAVVARAAGFAGRSVTEDQRLTAAKKALGAKGETSFEYLDLKRTGAETYAELRGLADAGMMAAGAAAGVKVSENPLPPVEVVKKHLGPAVRVSWTGADGYHSRSTGPFPGAGMLSPAGVGTAGVAGVGAAVVLPSLNRARETANQNKCMANFRKIGVAMVEYASQHEGSFPANLGELVGRNGLTARDFVCPSGDGDASPAEELGLAEQAQWVKEHGEYVYLGKGMVFAKVAPSTVVAHENLGAHGGRGVCVLFGDAHVEFVASPRAEELVGKVAK